MSHPTQLWLSLPHKSSFSLLGTSSFYHTLSHFFFYSSPITIPNSIPLASSSSHNSFLTHHIFTTHTHTLCHLFLPYPYSPITVAPFLYTPKKCLPNPVRPSLSRPTLTISCRPFIHSTYLGCIPLSLIPASIQVKSLHSSSTAFTHTHTHTFH